MIVISACLNKKNLIKKTFYRILGYFWMDLKIKERLPRLYYLWYWTRSFLFFAIVVLAAGTKYENI